MTHLSAAVIGAGPAGLMAAEVLAAGGVAVEIYDAMPTAGRKFLMAGKGGLNITHTEPPTPFLARYGDSAGRLTPYIRGFGAGEIVTWIHALGIETFVGSSGRVFPKEMKAAPLLRAWLRRLRGAGVRFHMRHRWVGWRDQELVFDTPGGVVERMAAGVVLALGGASWPHLGSDGAWTNILGNDFVAPLRPANCGFDVNWSAHFAERFAGAPVKPAAIAGRQGEFIITANGVEGGLIYGVAAAMRDEIGTKGVAVLRVDLRPDRSVQQLYDVLSRPRGRASLATHLRKAAGLEGVKAGLVRECLSKDDIDDPARLAAGIKALPLHLSAARPISEAISSAGGVRFEALDDRLMLRARPGAFVAGEMLDWEAPTGGYLLTACLSTGRAAGEGLLAWLRGSGDI